MNKTDSYLTIGIERMIIVKGMAKTIEIAETKEDILYILQKMQDELKEGVAEIDQIVEHKDG